MANPSFQGDQAVEQQSGVQKPRRYRVLLLNDDFTDMDFVVHILKKIFYKSPAEAVSLMLRVHRQGRAVVGVYSREVAETKVDQVHREARQKGYPLQAIYEPND